MQVLCVYIFLIYQVHCPVFRVSDVVYVMDDRGEVAKMQKGHGEWAEDMALVYTVHTTQLYIIICTVHKWLCVHCACLELHTCTCISMLVIFFTICMSPSPLPLSPPVSGAARQGGEGAPIRRRTGGGGREAVGVQPYLPEASARRDSRE